MFELTHPGPTGRGGKGYRRLSVDKPGDPDDANYRLCYQCGFPCRIDQDQRGNSMDSPGLQQVTTDVSLQAGGTVAVIEMQVVAGCRFCGTLNYEGSHRMRTVPARSSKQRR